MKPHCTLKKFNIEGFICSEPGLNGIAVLVLLLGEKGRDRACYPLLSLIILNQ